MFNCSVTFINTKLQNGSLSMILIQPLKSVRHLKKKKNTIFESNKLRCVLNLIEIVQALLLNTQIN